MGFIFLPCILPSNFAVALASLGHFGGCAYFSRDVSDIFSTLSNSSSCRPSQITLPTVENSRLKDVERLYWSLSKWIYCFGIISSCQLSRVDLDLPRCAKKLGSFSNDHLFTTTYHLRLCLSAYSGSKRTNAKETWANIWMKKRWGLICKEAHRATVSHFEGNLGWKHSDLKSNWRLY